ncbi:hypothetical protein OV203_23230 [Nannocystis sp. ILAH1]|uniref:hypothetical protein n=1 Tax=unclassified Nannocystis TaxID=2627009 RepID=UPI00226DF072|nr:MULTISPECIES: hypothetical protein [unclassified Nannocystis]MCY0990072.1 hypothetical protein [Nannocystis sp. ILAH1]MCY1069639.1 hypothetical protein [Nannocystis sp. RBIL2]
MQSIERAGARGRRRGARSRQARKTRRSRDETEGELRLGQAGGQLVGEDDRKVAGETVKAAEAALLAEGQVVVRDDTTVPARDREGEATHVVAETAAELEVVEVGSGGDVAGVESAGEAAAEVELAGRERPPEHGSARRMRTIRSRSCSSASRSKKSSVGSSMKLPRQTIESSVDRVVLSAWRSPAKRSSVPGSRSRSCAISSRRSLLVGITREVARAREWMRVVAGAHRRVNARAACIEGRVTRSRG